MLDHALIQRYIAAQPCRLLFVTLSGAPLYAFASADSHSDLRRCPILPPRQTHSAQMVIAIQKVENLPTDLLPERDRWWMMQRVRASQPILALSRDRNIRFVIPAEHLREGSVRGPLVAGGVSEMFGLKWQAMIQGLAFMSHQLGSFLGAYGGGLIYDQLGSYTMAWRVGVALGLAGGIIQVAFALIRPGRPPQLETS